jgi:predicted transcriptional regulator
MTDEIKMTIRLSPALRTRLSQVARRNRRSMHAEMIYLIERGLDSDRRREQRAATRAASTEEAE